MQKGLIKMRIKIINPDVNEGISEVMQKRAMKYVSPGTEVDCNSPSFGVHSVDNVFTWNISSVSVIDELVKSEKEGNYDAYVIACFWNPGLLACREITKKPVIGIGQAALLMSQFVGENAAIMCVGDGGSYFYRDDIIKYGMKDRIAALKYVDIVAEDSFTNPEHAKKLIIEAAKKAVEQDKADVIILGCGVMAEFSEAVEEAVGVPVVNPLGAGLKVAEALVSLGLKNSKKYCYRYPAGSELINFDGVLNEIK